MNALRAIRRTMSLSVSGRGAHFKAVRISGENFGPEGSPWLGLDHFWMAGPTFPPHPHAGFSAVTYVLPESINGINNRDSRGDRSYIAPGGLHWTAAGSGIVHEEVPAVDGVVTEGFQIFIRQPADQESEAPKISRAKPEDLPTLILEGGARLGVVAGAYENVRAGYETPSPLTMLDVRLGATQTLRWMTPADQPSLAVYVAEGDVAFGNAPSIVKGSALVVFEPGIGDLFVRAESDAKVFVMTGTPLPGATYSNGPFAMSSPAALQAAVVRYQSGEMGRLS